MSHITRRIRYKSFTEINKKENYEWLEVLTDYFKPYAIEDISDFDRQDNLQFLVGINNDGISSDTFDDFLTTDNAYLFEISISGTKPISTCSFWMYPRGEVGVLKFSAHPFIPEHAVFLEHYNRFVADYDLLHVTEQELHRLTCWKRKRVSIYYKYFNNHFHDPRSAPVSDL